MIWHLIICNGWYVTKPNQAKSYIFNMWSIFTFILSFRKKNKYQIHSSTKSNMDDFKTICIYENLPVFAYFLKNGRIYLVSLKNSTFSNIFPRAGHIRLYNALHLQIHLNAYKHTQIRNYNPTTHTYTHTQPHVKEKHTKSQQFLTVFFQFSIYFIFLTAWWLLFCKKLLETQGSQSKFHELNIHISNIYLFIIII